MAPAVVNLHSSTLLQLISIAARFSFSMLCVLLAIGRPTLLGKAMRGTDASPCLIKGCSEECQRVELWAHTTRRREHIDKYADDSSSSSTTESKPIGGALICVLKCEVKCAPFLIVKPVYQLCFLACLATCNAIPINVAIDCITSSELTKPVDPKIDGRDLEVFMDSSLQACKNRS
ncbi:hypothetical protein RJT34_15418 [Clitoria ternatea]|uniref:Uncharacterized protein n=1 Tax=Clitoria ternatea TaxID=43366 RepID=A0AAN9J5Q0_CLITE